MCTYTNYNQVQKHSLSELWILDHTLPKSYYKTEIQIFPLKLDRIWLFLFRKDSQIHIFSKKTSWPRQAGEMGWQMLYDTQQEQI